ncbi:hypothetical protein PN498_15890 [Oscillatoria sp. CS-180]|uniref:hypothetical protein n=1 Tax=Oscillatoria sp. CS-180 TaxID=3021720 RepID=UPI00232D5713|nr:hypothetical protein [Oscillatoria sp. CS-180]MDB9527479.1 hypothetical protein [Oscillatoria sp. CS-180]
MKRAVAIARLAQKSYSIQYFVAALGFVGPVAVASSVRTRREGIWLWARTWMLLDTQAYKLKQLKLYPSGYADLTLYDTLHLEIG